MENKRTIQTILSLKTGELLEAGDLFKGQNEREAEIFQLRTKLEQQLQKKEIEYVCIYCKQPVAIRGRSNKADHTKHYYFTHPYRSDDCMIKTQSRFTEEQIRCIKYNAQKESELHERLKNYIAHYLEQDNAVSRVNVEQVYRERTISNEWRKPDVLAIYGDKKIAFELQLSTTFLSVIVARTIFYRERGVFLIWVFPNFSLLSDIQKFTQKDVYYNNNFNVYVFDEEAVAKSKKSNELILKCHYKEFYPSHADIVSSRWITTFVKISDLQFDHQKTNVCFYDSEAEKVRIEGEFEMRKIELAKIFAQKRRDENIERVVNYLRDFYKNDRAPWYNNALTPLDFMETQEDVVLLNEKLKFTSTKSDFISKLFVQRNKPNFIRFICEQDKIFIDTTHPYVDGKSLFYHLSQIDDEIQFDKYITLLFRKGHRLTNEDKVLHDELFKKNYFNVTEGEKSSIRRWAFIGFLASLKSYERAFDIVVIEKVLYAIASLKYNLVIGSGLLNLRQVAINFFQNRKDFGNIYIHVMQVYGQYETLKKEDKSGKFSLKLKEYISHNHEQEMRYDGIIEEIFPELFK